MDLFCLHLVLFITIMCKVFRVDILQETCLASKDAMPFDLLKRKLMSRLETMGIRILKTYEEVNFTILCCLLGGMLNRDFLFYD